jgi:hypothetical protein
MFSRRTARPTYQPTIAEIDFAFIFRKHKLSQTAQTDVLHAIAAHVADGSLASLPLTGKTLSAHVARGAPAGFKTTAIPVASTQVDFFHRDIVESVTEIARRNRDDLVFVGRSDHTNVGVALSEKNVVDDLGSKSFAQDERVYSEPWTADRWLRTQLLLPLGTHPLYVIFASDGSKHRSTTFTPVYATLANLPLRLRRKTANWTVVALMPPMLVDSDAKKAFCHRCYDVLFASFDAVRRVFLMALLFQRPFEFFFFLSAS